MVYSVDFSRQLVAVFLVLIGGVLCLSQPLIANKNLRSNLENVQMGKRQFKSISEENNYLYSLQELDAVDLCFVGCRVCFEKVTFKFCIYCFLSPEYDNMIQIFKKKYHIFFWPGLIHLKKFFIQISSLLLE